MVDLASHPISKIEWLDVNLLDANDYNPNYVMETEMKLLALSILKQGWIQPILVWPIPGTDRFTIIDGFHRHMIIKTVKDVWTMTDGKVPCCRMEMTVPDRMLLTIRINRAKGNHAAVKMHEIVSSLVKEHGYSPTRIANEIGGTEDEITVLLAENIFEHKRVTETQYTRAWYTPGTTEHGMLENA